MPFYIKPSGETFYAYNGIGYHGYGGPDDLVGVTGEYAPGTQFNTGGGVNTNPIAVSESQAAGLTAGGSQRVAKTALPLTDWATPENSRLAHDNSLRAQGINPAELPYGQYGQLRAGQVQAQHNLPISPYIVDFLGSAQAPAALRTAMGDTSHQWSMEERARRALLARLTG